MRLESDKDLVLIDGKMGRSILAIGKIMWLVGMESCYMKMVMFMKGIGKMTRLMDMGSILRRMGLYIKDNGKMISNMERALRYGEKMPNMKGIILWVKKLGLEN